MGNTSTLHPPHKSPLTTLHLQPLVITSNGVTSLILEGTNISTNASKLQFATNQYQNTLMWVTYITLAIHYITPVHRVKTVTLRRTHTTILTTTILGTLQLRQSQLHRQSPQYRQYPQHRQSSMDTTVTTTTTAVYNIKQHSSVHQDSRWILPSL